MNSSYWISVGLYNKNTWKDLVVVPVCRLFNPTVCLGCSLPPFSLRINQGNRVRYMWFSAEASQMCCITEPPHLISIMADMVAVRYAAQLLQPLGSQQQRSLIWTARPAQWFMWHWWWRQLLRRAGPPPPHQTLPLLGTTTQVNQFIHSAAVWGHHKPAVHD